MGFHKLRQKYGTKSKHRTNIYTERCSSSRGGPRRQLQIFKGNHLQNNAESQISAMAYLDLILRSVTEPGLLQIFVRFLLDADKFDGQRILDVLVDRINSVDTRV